jgi:hypothetical protein
MTEIHREARRAAVEKAIRIALIIGHHGVPSENEADLSAALAEVAMARTHGELLSAHHALYLQMDVAGLELPPETMQ